MLALQLEAGHPAADDSMTDVGIPMTVDRGIRRGRQHLEGRRGNEGLSGSVLEHVEVVDDAPVGEIRDPLHQLVHREAGEVDEFQLVFVRGERPACHALPIPVEIGASRNDEDPAGARLESEAEGERAGQISRNRNADDVGGQGARLQLLLIDGDEYDGDSRKNLRPIREREIERRPEGRHDQINLLSGVLLVQVFDQESLVTRVFEAREIEVLVADLDLLGGGGGERRAEPLIDQHTRGTSYGVFRRQQDDGPGVAWVGRVRRRAEPQDGEERHRRERPPEAPACPVLTH